MRIAELPRPVLKHAASAVCHRLSSPAAAVHLAGGGFLSCTIGYTHEGLPRAGHSAQPGTSERNELDAHRFAAAPARQIDLGWPSESVSPAAFETLFRLLSLGRWNRLGLVGEDGAGEIPVEVRQSAEKHGIRLVPVAQDTAFRLYERPTILPPYS